MSYEDTMAITEILSETYVNSLKGFKNKDEIRGRNAVNKAIRKNLDKGFNVEASIPENIEVTTKIKDEDRRKSFFKGVNDGICFYRKTFEDYELLDSR